MDKAALYEVQRDFTVNALDRWKAMLAEPQQERQYHQFLKTHAGLFLSTGMDEALVVSELRLGADHAIDFVIVRDEYSAGITYECVELETPHLKSLFTKPHKPIDRLNTALAQVASWRRWIENHPKEAADLFPSRLHWHGAPLRMRYKIIIGRRPTDSEETRPQDIDREWASRDHGVEIRSFDYLSSCAHKKLSTYFNELDRPDQSSQYPSYLKEPLARLNWPAIGHSTWRALTRDPRFQSHHLLEKGYQLILEAREGSLAP